jgi:hypothetical protein
MAMRKGTILFSKPSVTNGLYTAIYEGKNSGNYILRYTGGSDYNVTHGTLYYHTLDKLYMTWEE